MNEYIFYTSEGFTYAPNENIAVENCQVLGHANGSNVNEARNSLLNENQWIREANFSTHKFYAQQVLTDEQRTDIRALINYVCTDEKLHSEENIDKRSQICNIIKRLSDI